jgi:formate hydrogenlyase subunit 6/NADH:ubiquinone oxidoreductase subunit I
MYCGLCANACSTRAIFHTKRFEMNKFNLDDLVMRFVSDSERDQAKSRAKEIEAEALAKKAAKKKAKQAELDKTSKNGGDNK